MIAGTIVLEDHILIFRQHAITNRTEYTVTDIHEGEEETRLVDSKAFGDALAIAVHPDGLSDVITDEMQESAEEAIGEIRWIP
jgi:hypothetical protein